MIKWKSHLAGPSFSSALRVTGLLGAAIALHPALAAASGPPDAPDLTALDAQLHQTLATAGFQPALRENLQRPVDPRLLQLEKLGIEGSKLFPGRRYEVRNAREVEALSGKLQPGDRLVLVGPDWRDTRFVFGGVGTREAPILVTAEPSAEPFSGESGVAFFGEHLVITDLIFRGGAVRDAIPATSADEPPATNGKVPGVVANLIRLGAGPDRPANHCIIHRLTVDNVNSPRRETWTQAITRYVLVDGHDDTIANSSFTHLMHYGDVIATGGVPNDIPQRLHVLNNRFTDRPRLEQEFTPYRFKIIQIGWSGLKAAPSGSLIQGNLFEDCASFVELVSIKASDVFFRGNRLIRCEGAINIRFGDRALIQGNVIDGENQAGTGGLRVAGRDHVIIGNTFKRLRPTKDNYMVPPPQPPTPYLTWTLSIVIGDHEYSGFKGATYGRAQNILISHNRFEGNSGRIALGSATPTLSPQLFPRRIWIEHNVFTGDGKGDQLFDHIAEDPAGPLLSQIFLYDNLTLP